MNEGGSTRDIADRHEDLGEDGIDDLGLEQVVSLDTGPEVINDDRQVAEIVALRCYNLFNRGELASKRRDGCEEKVRGTSLQM